MKKYISLLLISVLIAGTFTFVSYLQNKQKYVINQASGNGFISALETIPVHPEANVTDITQNPESTYALRQWHSQTSISDLRKWYVDELTTADWKLNSDNITQNAEASYLQASRNGLTLILTFTKEEFADPVNITAQIYDSMPALNSVEGPSKSTSEENPEHVH